MTTPAEFQHYYRVPAIHDEETRGILPDLGEVGHVDHVAEYDRASDTFVISTVKPVRGLSHVKVDRPEHGVHASPRATPPTPFTEEAQASFNRLHDAQQIALLGGKDPALAGSKVDKRIVTEAHDRGEQPQ